MITLPKTTKHGPARTLIVMTHDGVEYRVTSVTSWAIKDGLLACYGLDSEEQTIFLGAYVLENLLSFHWE
jgi:hypothetical protein